MRARNVAVRGERAVTPGAYSELSAGEQVGALLTRSSAADRIEGMNVIRYTTMSVAVFAMGLSVSSCGDDDDGMGLSPAQRHGVGAACSADSDCFVGDTHLRCLPFKGGYCGLGRLPGYRRLSSWFRLRCS